MDEEIAIIDEKTRNEKVKNFLIKNKKILISIVLFLILSLVVFYSYKDYTKDQKVLISDKFNTAIIEYKNGDKSRTASLFKEIVYDKESTYSPLALYFLIDNNLIENKKEINILFDIVIDETSLENEIKNLIIYKKALYNANSTNENQLLIMLNPLINSKSVWKSHALYLLAEYFYSKNEKQKSKEFFNEIIILENANSDLKKEAQKRVNRDLSD